MVEKVINQTLAKSEDNFEKIIFFLRLVDDSYAAVIGYHWLYDKMSNDSHLSHMNAIILANEMQQHSYRMTNVRDLLRDQVTALVNGNVLDGFFSYANTNGSSRDVMFVKEVMPMIVRMAYTKPTHNTFGMDSADIKANIKNLMTLMGRFSNIHHQLYLLNDLMVLMKEFGHTEPQFFFQLLSATAEIRRIHMPQDRRHHRSQDDEFLNGLFAQFEETFPAALRIFLYPNSVCMQNVGNSEYLQIGNHQHFRDVATTQFVSTLNFEMDFKFNENGFASIINGQSREHIAVYKTTEDMVKPITGEESMQAKNSQNVWFQFESLGDDEFTIRSAKQLAYLVSSSHCYDFNTCLLNRHSVATKQYPSNNEAVWLVKKCYTFFAIDK